MAIIGQDTFIRANQSGWGTASDGQTWVEVGGTETPSIVSNEGILTGTIGGDTVMALGSKTQADTDCLVRVEVNNAGAVVPGVIFRLDALGTSYYRVKNNSGLLGCTRVNAGSASAVGTAVAATFTSNTFYWLHANIVGSTINANWWADGGSEPGGWMFTAVDGTPISAAGQFGLYCNNSSTATDSGTFDSFTATDTIPVVPTRNLYPRFIPRALGATIIPDPVKQPLAYKERGIGGTIIYEIRTFIPRALGGTYIPETWRMMPRAFGARFVQSFDQLKDITTRFRLKSADQVKDIQSRFRLMSANQLKDIVTRFRLKSADQLKDITSRFRLKSANQLKDVQSRFRLMSAAQLKDVASRFRLKSADQLKDVASRFRLMSANQFKDIVSRFRLKSADQFKDITTRFILATPGQRLKDVASRFRLKSADQLKDIASRFRLMSANQLKDITSRFRLMSANQIKDVASRFRLKSANQLKDIQSRFRVMSANQLRDISTRLRLKSANQLRDIASRFVLHGVGTLSTRDISTRFVLSVPSNATWIARDGLISWLTRDDKVAWDTRDDLATWKTR